MPPFANTGSPFGSSASSVPAGSAEPLAKSTLTAAPPFVQFPPTAADGAGRRAIQAVFFVSP